MRQTPRSSIVKRWVFIFACTVLIVAQPGRAQRGAGGGEWRHYGGDAGGTKYSALDQINASNVNKLQMIWLQGTNALRGHEGQPLVIKDVGGKTENKRAEHLDPSAWEGDNY